MWLFLAKSLHGKASDNDNNDLSLQNKQVILLLLLGKTQIS